MQVSLLVADSNQEWSPPILYYYYSNQEWSPPILYYYYYYYYY